MYITSWKELRNQLARSKLFIHEGRKDSGFWNFNSRFIVQGQWLLRVKAGWGLKYTSELNLSENVCGTNGRLNKFFWPVINYANSSFSNYSSKLLLPNLQSVIVNMLLDSTFTGTVLDAWLKRCSIHVNMFRCVSTTKQTGCRLYINIYKWNVLACTVWEDIKKHE